MPKISAISKALGGRKALRDAMSVSDSLFARLLGISEKTLSRSRVGRARLDPVASDRLFRLAQIVALVTDVLEDGQRAVQWLKRAQIGLGRRIPLSLLTTDAGRNEVEKLLLRIEHGVYT